MPVRVCHFHLMEDSALQGFVHNAEASSDVCGSLSSSLWVAHTRADGFFSDCSTAKEFN